MDTLPVAPRKRKQIEFGIRLIDIACYIIIFSGGMAAMFFTPESIVAELHGYEWIIPYWATMLLVGGLLGFTARVSTIWIMEPAADIISMFGITIYFVVLGKTAFETFTSILASCLILVALLGVVRRYLELQLFGSNPDDKTIQARLHAALARRIPNVPPRG